jgi:hypothetical protein
MEVPAWFKARLFDTDPNLVVYFNPFKQRWVIDRKAENGLNTNVMIVQSEDGEFMPLSDSTLDRIKSMDAWKQYGSYEAFHRHNIQVAAEDAAKREAAIRENYRLNSLDNKRQLRQVYNLIQRHDVARVNQ